MKEVINFIKDINGCYLVLNILFLICLYLYLKNNKVSKLKKRIIFITFLLINIITFPYFNGVIQSIFRLKYLSVKMYLLVVAITNLITLFTLNKKIKLGYSIINYTLFILIIIIFGSTLAVVLGNQFEELYIMDISNAVTLIDLSFVIFILYLIILTIIYIGYYLFSNHSMITKKEIVQKKEIIKNFVQLKQENKNLKKQISKEKTPISIWKQKPKSKNLKNVEEQILTSEELLNYENKNHFSIHGVECGIIFEDSNPENIIKNYHILLNDIHAKLVNGFTLEENHLLKSICTKLQTGNLNGIDLNNANVLNRVSIEEYNFLKKIIGV